MNISIRKLVIFTLVLLLANFITSSIMDSMISASRGYDDGTSTLQFVWTYLIIIPGIALVIGLLAALSMNKSEPYLARCSRSFLTTTVAIYLLFALPKFALIGYKLIQTLA